MVASINPEGSSELRLMRKVLLMRSLDVAAASAHLLAALMAYSEDRLVLVIMSEPISKPRQREHCRKTCR